MYFVTRHTHLFVQDVIIKIQKLTCPDSDRHIWPKGHIKSLAYKVETNVEVILPSMKADLGSLALKWKR